MTTENSSICETCEHSICCSCALYCTIMPILEVVRFAILLPGLPIYGISATTEYLFTGSTDTSYIIGLYCLPSTVKSCMNIDWSKDNYKYMHARI